jgi:hypothetical protein
MIWLTLIYADADLLVDLAMKTLMIWHVSIVELDTLSRLRILINSYKLNKDNNAALTRVLEGYSGLVPDSLQECETRLQQVWKELHQLTVEAYQHRKNEQEIMIAEKLAAGDKVGAAPVRNIKVAEETKEMF